VNFGQKYGPWAVIAGGSEGVGACFARRLAERGLDLVLTARKPGPLDALAAEIRAAFPERRVRTVAGDLCEPACRAELKATTRDVEIGFLVYNAGAASRTGPFLDEAVDFAQHLVALNITAKIDLTHHYAAAMRARGHGGILLIGSMAGIGGTPGIAVYSAVKSFSISFSEALWAELKPCGVDVLGFQLGATNTPAMARHYPAMATAGADPDTVARQGLELIADGPIQFAGDGAAWAASLARMSRAEAVETRAAASAAYRKTAAGGVTG
jgi:short-subunit dehydrogenase